MQKIEIGGAYYDNCWPTHITKLVLAVPPTENFRTNTNPLRLNRELWTKVLREKRNCGKISRVHCWCNYKCNQSLFFYTELSSLYR